MMRSAILSIRQKPISQFYSSTAVGILLLLVGLSLFGQTLFKPFLCDDYTVMYRLVYQHEFFLHGFFRPVSDLTLYFCYLVGGEEPFLFNLFNLLFHILCAFLLYLTCLKVSFFRASSIPFISITSSVLFLVYPYHNESIVWIVGRASMMACFFAFLALFFSLRPIRSTLDYLWPCLFYFIGLCSYETILPLPGIILIFLFHPQKSLKSYVPWVAGFSITLGVNFFIRYKISGVIWGSYGQKLFSPSTEGYLANFVKVIGRSFLPPSDNSRLLIALSVAIALLAAFFLYKVVREKRDKAVLIKLTAALLLSYIVPVMFGISTRTFEGDRLVYFSSFFLMLWTAFYVSLIKTKIFRNVAFGGILIYFIVFLFKNNAAWIKAGLITNNIIKEVKNIASAKKQIGLINIPQEYNGALIFRNGLAEALLMNGIDANRVLVLRSLISEEARQVPGAITLQGDKKNGFIFPNTTFYKDSIIKVIQPLSGSETSYFINNFSHFLYWNKQELLLVK
ncbi:MAG: hypothetical protein JWP69_2008 [Flaviaesturariibacter sp.]|nr:hypothetical protein [Flaviaesturariibacter sp.]